METKIKKVKLPVYKERYNSLNPKLYTILAFDFKNTSLENFVPDIVHFFAESELKHYDYCIECIYRELLQNKTKECLDFAKFLRDIKNGVIKGQGWQITSKEDISTIYSSIEKLFLDKIDDFGWAFDENRALPEGDINYQVTEWEEMFLDFPSRNSFEFEDIPYNDDGKVDEDTDHHLSLAEINYSINVLGRYVKIAKNLKVETDKRIINRFLEYMLGKGIPHTRETYRELYKVVDNYGLIPDDIKKGHSTTTSKYEDSNYIKSLVNTILKNNERHQL